MEEFDEWFSRSIEPQSRFILPNQANEEHSNATLLNACYQKRYSKDDSKHWVETDQQPAGQGVSQTSQNPPGPELHGGTEGVYTKESDRWVSMQQEAIDQPPKSQNQNVPDSRPGLGLNWVKNGDNTWAEKTIPCNSWVWWAEFWLVEMPLYRLFGLLSAIFQIYMAEHHWACLSRENLTVSMCAWHMAGLQKLIDKRSAAVWKKSMLVRWYIYTCNQLI